MVGAVGEMASMKRRKLWKTGEDGLCCSSSAIQTRLGPSSLLEEQSEIPIVFIVVLCCGLPSKLEETAKVYRIYRIAFDETVCILILHMIFLIDMASG